MSFAVLLAVLAAALLHASWNAIIKIGLSKQTSMFILSVGHAAVGLAVALTHPVPVAAAWPWLIASGLIHMAYQLFLAYAYDHGDLSRVYPIARGTAPMLVLLIGGLVLSDAISFWEHAGILVLGAGILLSARGVFANGESRRLLPYALGAAVATAGYSLSDGLGARVSGDALGYVGWLMMLSALFFTPAIVALRGTAVLRAGRNEWLLGLLAAAASFAAYAIAVWAMTVAPIALVAGLRETSILFAVLIGWLAFREPMTTGKVTSVALIALGVILTRF